MMSCSERDMLVGGKRIMLGYGLVDGSRFQENDEMRGMGCAREDGVDVVDGLRLSGMAEFGHLSRHHHRSSHWHSSFA